MLVSLRKRIGQLVVGQMTEVKKCNNHEIQASYKKNGLSSTIITRCGTRYDTHGSVSQTEVPNMVMTISATRKHQQWLKQECDVLLQKQQETTRKSLQSDRLRPIEDINEDVVEDSTQPHVIRRSTNTLPNCSSNQMKQGQGKNKGPTMHNVDMQADTITQEDGRNT